MGRGPEKQLGEVESEELLIAAATGGVNDASIHLTTPFPVITHIAHLGNLELQHAAICRAVDTVQQLCTWI